MSATSEASDLATQTLFWTHPVVRYPLHLLPMRQSTEEKSSLPHQDIDNRERSFTKNKFSGLSKLSLQ